MLPPPAPLPEVEQSIDEAYQKKHDRPPARTVREDEHDSAPRYFEGEAGPSALTGYAYTGGGRRINRVEVSFDNGYNWKLAKVDYPEDLYRTITHADSTFGKFDLNERDTSL